MTEKWYGFANFAERNACAEAKAIGVCCYVNENKGNPPQAVRQYWDGESWKALGDSIPPVHLPEDMRLPDEPAPTEPDPEPEPEPEPDDPADPEPDPERKEVASYTLASATRNRWTEGVIAHKPHASGAGGSNSDPNRYGQIGEIYLDGITNPTLSLDGEFRELWYDVMLIWGPDARKNQDFDWQEAWNGSYPRQSGKFFGFEAWGDQYRKPGYRGTGNVQTKLPEGWSTRCSFSGDEKIDGIYRPGLAQTYLYDQARTKGQGGRKLKWYRPWGSKNCFQFDKGRPYRVTQRIVINSRADEAGYRGSQSDGIWEQFIDGELVFQATNLKFRGDCDHVYRYDTSLQSEGGGSQYLAEMVKGMKDGDVYEPGPRTRRALISKVNYSNFYGGSANDGPARWSYVGVGTMLLWSSKPDFSQKLPD